MYSYQKQSSYLQTTLNSKETFLNTFAPIVRFPVFGHSGIAYLATSLTSRWVQNYISLKHKQTRGGPHNAFPMAHDSWLPFDMTRINLRKQHPYNSRLSFHVSRLIYWKGSLLQLERTLRVTVCDLTSDPKFGRSPSRSKWPTAQACTDQSVL